MNIELWKFIQKYYLSLLRLGVGVGVKGGGWWFGVGGGDVKFWLKLKNLD